MSGLVERQASRVLLLDADDRVLLFRGSDPDRPDEGDWWFTPGGGLRRGESHQAAALRELAEETGLTGVPLGPAVWERTCVFWFGPRRYRQHEVFFLVRVDAHDVDVRGFTELERRVVHEHRWWTVAELTATSARVYPTTIAAELALLLREGPPEHPHEVASDDAA
ncbi:MAG: NUDIX hydrolase [Actinomycetia bacterium]|nr:NUDIX hydrolase [Actinomycetes bacterium]